MGAVRTWINRDTGRKTNRITIRVEHRLHLEGLIDGLCSAYARHTGDHNGPLPREQLSPAQILDAVRGEYDRYGANAVWTWGEQASRDVEECRTWARTLIIGRLPRDGEEPVRPHAAGSVTRMTDSFTAALIDAMCEGGHECDELCETGEEFTEWEQIHADGRTTLVIGPASLRPAVTPVHVKPLDVRDADGNPVRPLPPPSVLHLPGKVGRARREEILAKAQAENPGAEVSVDCHGGALIIPTELLRARSDQ